MSIDKSEAGTISSCSISPTRRVWLSTITPLGAEGSSFTDAVMLDMNGHAGHTLCERSLMEPALRFNVDSTDKLEAEKQGCQNQLAQWFASQRNGRWPKGFAVWGRATARGGSQSFGQTSAADFGERTDRQSVGSS